MKRSLKVDPAVLRAKLSERKAALSERRAALSERPAALSDRKAALSNRTAALSKQTAALSERKASSRAALAGKKTAAREAMAEKTAAAREAMAARKAAARERRGQDPRKKRRWWPILLALLLLLLVRNCRCEEEVPPQVVPEEAVVVPVEAGGGSRAIVPPPPKAVPRRARPAFAPVAPGPLPWLSTLRLQVAARSPRLAECFVGARRPGALKWTAAVDPGLGRVSDQALDTVLTTEPLTREQRDCAFAVLSDPAYVLVEGGDERSTPVRVGLVVEF